MKKKEELQKQESSKQEKKIRILIPGSFDLLNMKHVQSIIKTKDLYPDSYIIIGIFEKKDLEENEGPLINTEKETAENLKHSKWVDDVIQNIPWQIKKDFLDKNQIDLVVDSQIDPKCGYYNTIFGEVKSIGKLVVQPSEAPHASHRIISQVISNCEDYILRNLKRGYGRKELNVSIFEEIRVRMKKKISEFFSRFKNCLKRKAPFKID